MEAQPLVLSAPQRAELTALREHAAKPYLRERASALLKMADGQSASAVAAHGLLQRRDHHTLGQWRQRYLAEGIVGLTIRPGRGRKPVFSPSQPERRARRA